MRRGCNHGPIFRIQGASRVVDKFHGCVMSDALSGKGRAGKWVAIAAASGAVLANPTRAPPRPAQQSTMRTRFSARQYGTEREISRPYR